jgi:hypothetical protein
MYNLYTNDDGTNQTDITLDNITTIHCVNEHFQAMKHFLIHIFPNARYLMLSYSSKVSASSSLQRYDDYFREKWMTTDSIYSSKVQYVEIKIMLEDMDGIDQYIIHLIKELIEMFIKLQSFIFHFYENSRFPSIVPFIDLNKTIQFLNMEEFAEIYQIKHIHNYLQFIKRD